MKRREFIIALVAAAALILWLLVAREQQADQVRALQIRILRLQAEGAATLFGEFIHGIESQIGWTVQLPWSAARWTTASMRCGSCGSRGL